MEIIDHRMVGSLHVDVVDRLRAEAEADAESTDGAGAAAGAFQTSTIEALLDGAYEGDLTLGELLAHGDLGIGTVDHLDGELVVLDGEAWVVSATGAARRAGPDEGTPFAVVCRFTADHAEELGPCAGLGAVTTSIEAAAPHGTTVLAVRIDGSFPRARVRSVARQEPPYPPLREVVAHQREWELTDVAGTVVGFRFPDRTDGLEVPGWHLHLITDDRQAGGHLMELALTSGRLHVQATDVLHVEVPDAVAAGPVGSGMDRSAEIDAVEGRGGGPED